MLETLVSEILLKYVDSIELKDNIIETIIRIIALESRKHAEYIELIAKKLNLFEQTDCAYVVGELWHKLKELLEQLVQGVKIDLRNFIEKQIWLEKAVGEETYQKFLLPLISEAIKIGCISEEAIKIVEIVLDKIVSDEKWHEKMLQAIYETSMS